VEKKRVPNERKKKHAVKTHNRGDLVQFLQTKSKKRGGKMGEFNTSNGGEGEKCD